VSPQIALKVDSWRRAGLLGPAVIRQQIAVLEHKVDCPFLLSVSVDLEELHELLASMERGA
jgi:hypothetical protein